MQDEIPHRAHDDMSLIHHIRAEIEASGPMTIARYMGLALGHPEFGYYITRDPFGAKGDFTTAPEISQMFGEMIGLWCADAWSKSGSPDPVRLVEIGPGRGTLMADALRAAAALPAFAATIDVHLVETSPVLREHQASKLAHCRRTVTWHDRFEDVGPGPALVIANELFDALPVHQFERRDGHWRERCIGNGPGGGLALRLSPDPAVTGAVPETFSNAPEGAIFEAAPARDRLAATIATRICAHGGAALIVDYGHQKEGLGDTLQALRSHSFDDPFANPGHADITSHVDFAGLARAAQNAGAAISGPAEMGTFLLALGIAERAAGLKSGTPADAVERIDAAISRLTRPDQMGSLFKVLALTVAGAPAPAPFS